MLPVKKILSNDWSEWGKIDSREFTANNKVDGSVV